MKTAVNKSRNKTNYQNFFSEDIITRMANIEHIDLSGLADLGISIRGAQASMNNFIEAVGDTRRWHMNSVIVPPSAAESRLGRHSVTWRVRND